MNNWNCFRNKYKVSSAVKSLTLSITSALLLIACSNDSDEPTNSSEPTVNLGLQQVVDPAPLFNDAGEFGCEGCPDSDLSTDPVTTNESVQSFSGLIDNVVGNGQWYVEAFDGRAVGGDIETDLAGNFSLETPLFCGAQVVKCVWSNEAGTYTFVTEIVRNQCTVSDIQLTLNWDDIGEDFELHLVKPGGKINDTINNTDCTWTTCISSQPDWGIEGNTLDNPVKDVDDRDILGPENIRLFQPENGTFAVMVEHWGDGQPEADGNVVLNVTGNETVVSQVTDLPSRHVWYVGDITWPSREIALDGRIIDCSDNWSSGCLLDLPSDIPPELVQP